MNNVKVCEQCERMCTMWKNVHNVKECAQWEGMWTMCALVGHILCEQNK